MVVIVNTACLARRYSKDYKNLLFDLFKNIASRQPGHQFVFLCTKEFTQKRDPGNIVFHTIGDPGHNLFKCKYWFDITLPRILKRYKADICVTAGAFCSLTTKLPQCMIMQVPDFVHYRGGYNKTQLLFYKKYFPAFIRKAGCIPALSQAARQSIIKLSPGAAGKTTCIYPGIGLSFQPASYPAKQAIREKYSDGKEYFLYGGDLQAAANSINLLKAFSLFKKRQQSNMKLLIVSFGLPPDKKFIKSLGTYKYRSDVLVLEAVPTEEYALLLASAYAFVYPVLVDGLCLRVMEAMQAGTPVITSDTELARELTGDAALLADAASPHDIAGRLMRIYKDENLRQELSGKASLIALSFSPEKAATGVWECIGQMVASQP